jgi:hypothetical protein
MRKLLSLFCFSVCIAVAGCGRVRDKSQTVRFEQTINKYTLLIVADIDLIKSNPKAFDFISYAIDSYAHDCMSESGQIVIAQLSGNNHPLLYHGSPEQLRKELSDREAFKSYLIAHSDPGRRLCDGLAESLEYTLKSYSVSQGKSATVALVVSTLNEGTAETPETEQRFVDTLVKFHRSGAKPAFYFCDQRRMKWIEEQTAKAGMSWVTLEMDINGRPPLPKFE